MKKSTVKKIGSITLQVLLYLFIAVCIVTLLVAIVSKKDADGTVTVFGYQMRTVLSPSMEKCDETYDQIKQYRIKDIRVRSMVFIDTVPTEAAEAAAWYESIREGDVLTIKYVYTKQETITHRVTGKTPIEGGYIITLTGDNKAGDANTLTQTINTTEANSPNYIIGRVVAQSYPFGLLVTALKTPVGLVCFVIIPALIIMIFEIIHIVSLLSAEKKQKAKEEKQKQDDELAELRRQLAQLQGTQPPPDDDTDNKEKP